MNVAINGIRWFFVLLLTAAAVGKLADVAGFYAVIKSYALLPEVVIPISAWALATTELALAAWLATGKRLHAATLMLIALHLAYLAWLAIALARDLDIPNCGCFGVFWARPLNWFTPIEDIVLLALAYFMWRGTRTHRSAHG